MEYGRAWRHKRYPQTCVSVFSRVIPESDKGISPRAILKDVSDKREVDLRAVVTGSARADRMEED